MENPKQLFYQRLSSNLISIILVVVILIYGKTIILPLLNALLLANLLLPVIRILTTHGFNRSLSIVIVLVGSIVIGWGILFFLSSQVSGFLDDLPALRERMSALISSAQIWVRENVHIAIFKQNQYVNELIENLKDEGPGLLVATFVSLKEIATYLLLVPVYTFLILYYKDTIRAFLVGFFKNGSAQKVTEVLDESTGIAQHYVLGLIIETSVVFTLNFIGFSVLGIKYKVFLSLLAAVLNLIPFIGIWVAGAFCAITTLVSSDSLTDSVWVAMMLCVVHLFDNNIGMPLIVGNRIRINALAIVLGVLVGGTLFGVPGMFLAIPSLAVLKIIFDKVPELEPWSILIGDTASFTQVGTLREKFKRQTRKIRSLRNNKNRNGSGHSSSADQWDAYFRRTRTRRPDQV